MIMLVWYLMGPGLHHIIAEQIQVGTVHEILVCQVVVIVHDDVYICSILHPMLS